MWPFTVPKSAPAGEAIFSWTWFNKFGGRREMYMNCAHVNIDNTAGALSDWEAMAPLIFKANIFGATCTTPENTDVVFPNPGPADAIEYGNPELKGSPPTVMTGCPADAGAAPAGDAGAGGAARAGGVAIPTGGARATPTAAAAGAPAETPQANSCASAAVSGKITCGANGDTWAVCVGGKLKEMGPVSAGTACKNGAMVRKEGMAEARRR